MKPNIKIDFRVWVWVRTRLPNPNLKIEKNAMMRRETYSLVFTLIMYVSLETLLKLIILTDHTACIRFVDYFQKFEELESRLNFDLLTTTQILFCFS
jgi:hypothetical protein